MDYQDNSDRNRKTKVIVVTAIAAVLVIALGAWIITAAVKNANKGKTLTAGDTNTTSKVDENKGTSAPTTSPATQYSPMTDTTPSDDLPAVSQDVPAAEDIPSTGPEDLLLTALLMGSAVTLFGLNRNLAKKSA